MPHGWAKPISVIWLCLPPSRLSHSSMLDGIRCSVGSVISV